MLTNFSKRLWHMDWRIILALVLLLGILVGAMGWHAALPSSQVATSQDATIGSSTMWHPNLSQFASPVLVAVNWDESCQKSLPKF